MRKGSASAQRGCSVQRCIRREIHRNGDQAPRQARARYGIRRSETGQLNVFDPACEVDEQTINIILSDAVSAYLEPSIRTGSYAAVKPIRLAVILAKLGKGAAATGGAAGQGRAERRRREADQVAVYAGR